MTDFDFPAFGPPQEFAAGTPLFHQGHRPSVVLLITSGFVKTIRGERDDDALVSIRGAGWILGLSPALLDRPYATSGVTATQCSLRSLSLAAFTQKARHDPTFSARVLHLFARQARTEEILRAEMAVYEAQERLLRSIVRFVDLLDPPRRAGHVELTLPITNRELAQYVGVSTEHLSRLLSRLQGRGLLRRRRGALLLPLARWPQLASERPAVPD